MASKESTSYQAPLEKIGIMLRDSDGSLIEQIKEALAQGKRIKLIKSRKII